MRGPHRTAAIAIPKDDRIIGWVIRDAVPRVDYKVAAILVDQIDSDILIAHRIACICLVQIPYRQIGSIGSGDDGGFDVKVVISINCGSALVSARIARTPICSQVSFPPFLTSPSVYNGKERETLMHSRRQ